MNHIKSFDTFVNESVEHINESVPSAYKRYLKMLTKLKYMQDDQKKLSEPYFKAKESGDEAGAEKHLAKLKKHQEKINDLRGSISYIENNYINNMNFFDGETKQAKKTGKYDAADWGQGKATLTGDEWY